MLRSMVAEVNSFEQWAYSDSPHNVDNSNWGLMEMFNDVREERTIRCSD